MTTPLRTLWILSYPLMLSYFSYTAMLFIDRVFLARYSSDAFTASVTGSMIAWAVTFGPQTFSEMSEVLVAQYNGAKQYRKLAKAPWQMMLLALYSVPLFFAIAEIGRHWVSELHGHNTEMGRVFYWIVLSGPFWMVVGAGSSYFGGQGRCALVMKVALVGNILNAALDAWFIFGLDGGAQGAAIATGISAAFQALFLLGLFLKEQWTQGALHYDSSTLKKASQIGLPFALMSTFEIGAWASFYSLMESVSPAHIAAAGVAQTLGVLLLFFGIGLEKGGCILAGNWIGAGFGAQVKQLVSYGLWMHTAFALLCFGVFWPRQDSIVELFLPSTEFTKEVKISILISLGWLYLENVRLYYSGLLMAAGDTVFLFLANTFCLATFLIIPTYLCTKTMHASVETCMATWLVYSVSILCLTAYRFYSGHVKWTPSVSEGPSP